VVVSINQINKNSKMTYSFTGSLEQLSLFLTCTISVLSSLPREYTQPGIVHVVFVSLREEFQVVCVSLVDVHVCIRVPSNTLAESFDGSHLVGCVVQGVHLLVEVGRLRSESQSGQQRIDIAGVEVRHV
jgi:hypothetical protein